MADPWHRWLTHPAPYRRLVIARMNLSAARASIDRPKLEAAYQDAVRLLAYAGETAPTEDYKARLAEVCEAERCKCGTSEPCPTYPCPCDCHPANVRDRTR